MHRYIGFWIGRLKTVEFIVKFTICSRNLFLRVQDDTVILGLKPFHSIILMKLMWSSNAAGFSFPVSYVHSGATKNNIKVHTINTNRGIVFNTQIDMFLDTKSKIAILTEVIPT